MGYYIIYIAYLFSSVILANELSFNTSWGTCTLINHSSLSSEKIIQTINVEIKKMYDNYGEIKINDFLILIPDSKTITTKHPHWKWSLGITYHNPDKIILKNPSLSKISWKKFQKVIAHELNHIMLNRVPYKHTIPRWFKEGFAMKTAGEISMNHKLKIASNTNNKYLFNLYDYVVFKNMNKQEFHFAYALSSASILLLEKIYGENIIENIIFNLIEGKNFQESFYKATGTGIEDFYNKFYNEIKNNFFWFKLINLPKNLFAIMPILLIIGFYMKSYRNQQIIKKWEIEEELEDIEIN